MSAGQVMVGAIVSIIKILKLQEVVFPLMSVTVILTGTGALPV